MTSNDSLEPDDDKLCYEIEHKSAAMIPEEKKDIRHEKGPQKLCDYEGDGRKGWRKK